MIEKEKSINDIEILYNEKANIEKKLKYLTLKKYLVTGTILGIGAISSLYVKNNLSIKEEQQLGLIYENHLYQDGKLKLTSLFQENEMLDNEITYYGNWVFDGNKYQRITEVYKVNKVIDDELYNEILNATVIDNFSGIQNYIELKYSFIEEVNEEPLEKSSSVTFNNIIVNDKEAYFETIDVTDENSKTTLIYLLLIASTILSYSAFTKYNSKRDILLLDKIILLASIKKELEKYKKLYKEPYIKKK